MADNIYISKLDHEFRATGIEISAWENCAIEIDHVKFKVSANGEPYVIEIFSTELMEEIPIFWIRQDGIGYMKQTPFFEYEEIFDIGIEIAKILNSSIYGENLTLIYLQDYGLLYDNAEPYNTLITTDDLINNTIRNDEDFIKSVNNLIENKSREVKSNHNVQHELVMQLLTNKKKQWWQFWK